MMGRSFPLVWFCHRPLGREHSHPCHILPEICRLFSPKSKQPVQTEDDLFQLSHHVTHSLPCFYSPFLDFLPRLSLFLSNFYCVSPVAFNSSGHHLLGILVCECKMFCWKKIIPNSFACIKSHFKEKHMNPQKVHIRHICK